MQCEFTGREIVSPLDFTAQEERVHQVLRNIGLALCASNGFSVSENSCTWKIDNRQELSELSWLSSFLKDIGIYRGCTCCNIDQSTERQGNS